MDLVREMLDNQLLDRRGRRMGKIDGLVAELKPGRPPQLRWIEVGGREPWRRLSRRFGRWGGDPYRIPVDKVRRDGRDFRVDVEAPETPAYYWERFWRDRFVRHLPGGR